LDYGVIRQYLELRTTMAHIVPVQRFGVLIVGVGVLDIYNICPDIHTNAVWKSMDELN
jgi:hypothetical protein